jgi:nicotinamide phosphoribosyltransferase
MKTNPATCYDGYKADHRRQYPVNSEMVFSNLTARGTRVEGVTKITFFGLQYFIKRYLIEEWNNNFFGRPVEEVVKKYNRRLNNYLGPNQIGDQHLRDLHALGYLPLEIWALPEGSAVNLRVPMFVVYNTDPRFYWLTNAIETILSVTLWLPCTSATTAIIYRRILNEWATKTNPEMLGFVPWQGHDFSFRGHSSYESAMTSGAAHLLAFTGTDTIPAIDFLEEYYNADSDKELVGGSVSATEHSVMCMGGLEDEVETFRRLIEDVYPTGIVSIVSDTWDFWNVINPDNGIVVQLKDKIMTRQGKVVIRPDSGDPVKIVTGINFTEVDSLDDDHLLGYAVLENVVKHENKYYEIEAYDTGWTTKFHKKEITELEVKGAIQCLWEIYGGTTTTTGYKQLDEHIGLIYGDSITIERAKQICERLEAKGFASTNLVYGIGSFTYQGAITKDAIVTRDTHGFAVKSTYGEVMENGVTRGIEIFKDPKTDDGLKKSAKGLTAVYKTNDDFYGDGFHLVDQATWDDVRNCAFHQVFQDGKITKEWTLAEIRTEVEKSF